MHVCVYMCVRVPVCLCVSVYLYNVCVYVSVAEKWNMNLEHGISLRKPHMDMTYRTRGHSVAFGGHWDKLLRRERHKQVSLAEEEGSISSYNTL